MERLIFITIVCAFMAVPLVADLTPIVGPPSDPTEPALLTVGVGILDTLYGLGNVVRIDDDFDQIWKNLDGGATATGKWAGADETFGYFPGASGGSFQPLFTIGAGTNQYNPPGASGIMPGYASLPIFRLALSSPFSGGLLWSSQESDNTAAQDHMVTWLITGGTNPSGAPNTAGNYVVAWEVENLASSSCDADYQDLVVEIGKAAPVPVPGAVLLGILGLSGAGLKLRRFA